MLTPQHNDDFEPENGEEARSLPILDAELTSNGASDAPAKGKACFWLVFFIAVATFFPNLGAFGLWDPWETHYGEVTRNMVETHDWVSPRWGYEGRPVGEPPAEKGPFFSKPVLIFWAQAISVRFFGFSEWAFRFPMALLAVLMVMMVYHSVRSITGSPWTAALAAIITNSSPQFFMIARQAQTDMPFVGTMGIGLFFLAIAIFKEHSPISDGKFLRNVVLTAIALALLIFPQLGIIATDVQPTSEIKAGSTLYRTLLHVWKTGFYHAIIYILFSLPVLGSIFWPTLQRWREGGAFSDEFKDLWSRRLNLYLFYAFIALATLSKGLLGFLLPGAIIFLFILVTWNWRLLAKVELLRGAGVFILVAFPWYVAMFSVHGMAYYSRFFVHDHFNRFGSGVHQVDTGLFEHFIKWLGLGIFPWSGLVPLALLPLFLILKTPRGRRDQFRIFLFIWAFFSFFLFTKSSTKFHHYIFPALIPLTTLVGMWLAALPKFPKNITRLAAILSIGFTMSLGWTIHDDWQTLRNLMTYKYDRPLPENLPVDRDDLVSDSAETTWQESRFFKETPSDIQAGLTSAWGYHPNVIRFVMGLAILSALMWLFFPTTIMIRAGTVGFTASALILAVWSLNVYLPMLTPAWSQKYIFDEYFDRCTLMPNPQPIEDVYTPFLQHAGLGSISEYVGARKKQVCEEDIISWLFTWRGETFYSNNEILPIAKTAYIKDYLTEFNEGKAFYAVVETHRESSFGTTLNREHRAVRNTEGKALAAIEKWKVETLHSENPFFVLILASPVLNKN